MTDSSFLAELAATYGTPCYVYDLDEIDECHRALREVIPSSAELLYSIKANPNPVVVRHLAFLGCGLEVSSTGELDLALENSPENCPIQYSGPATSPTTFAALPGRAIQRLTAVSAESIAIYRGLAELPALRSTSLCLRVNLADRNSGRLNMAGHASQFGTDDDQVTEFMRGADIREVSRVRGLHYFLATNVDDLAALSASFQHTAAFTLACERLLGHKFNWTNLGGGFPAVFGSAGPRSDLQPLREPLCAIARSLDPTRDRWLLFESGRYLTATAGDLVLSVIDVKHSRGERFAVLDGGINAIGGPSALGRVLRSHLEVKTHNNRANMEETSFVGPLCTPIDILARRIPASVAPGDMVSIPNVGAYGLTAGLTSFLSHSGVKEIVVRSKTRSIENISRLQSRRVQLVP